MIHTSSRLSDHPHSALRRVRDAQCMTCKKTPDHVEIERSFSEEGYFVTAICLHGSTRLSGWELTAPHETIHMPYEGRWIHRSYPVVVGTHRKLAWPKHWSMKRIEQRRIDCGLAEYFAQTMLVQNPDNPDVWR